jgi:hypothetical protein
MKNIALTFCLFTFYVAFASQDKGLYMQYRIDSTQFDKSLKSNESVFSFTFYNLTETHVNPKTELLFSFNGVNQHTKLDAQNHFDLNTKPGSYAFVFYYSSDYYEIYTDSIVGKSQHKTYVSIFFQKAEEQMIMVDKPVIYLYPENPLLVNVKVNPKGKFTFTYPTYENGWEVTAIPNGELKIGDNQYNYLFWEAAQDNLEELFDFSTGFIVDKENTVSFLEERLTEFGLNDKEKADFITFWGPQLMKNEHSFVHFVTNEDCNQFAELEITPKPDHIYRLYILITPISEINAHNFTEQILTKIDRTGFTVIEWGGTNFSNSQLPTQFN